jgi:hypothetical protein
MSSRVFGTKLATLALAAVCAGVVGVSPVSAGDKHKKNASDLETITVTVEGMNSAIDARDFAVFRGDERQQVVDVKGPSESPVNVAVLIQDGVDSGVGHEIKTIQEFIEHLPQGSKVMVGYLRGTHFQVKQAFTEDLGAASDAVRLPITTLGTVPSAPFLNLIEALKKFDGLSGRNQIVMVSNGLELNRDFSSASPSNNLDLDRAISEAQRRGIPVWSIFANAPGSFGQRNVVVSYGQGSLNRLSDETGGKAYFAGRGFVTFNHALDSITENLGRQYLIAYRGANDGEVEVTIETPGVKIRHASSSR